MKYQYFLLVLVLISCAGIVGFTFGRSFGVKTPKYRDSEVLVTLEKFVKRGDGEDRQAGLWFDGRWHVRLDTDRHSFQGKGISPEAAYADTMKEIDEIRSGK